VNNIKRLRESAGLTQKELAFASGFGSKQTRISNYETGARTPTIDEAYRIVAALNECGVSCVFHSVFPPSFDQKAS
jgi:putative transcriptional regulator